VAGNCRSKKLHNFVPVFYNLAKVAALKFSSWIGDVRFLKKNLRKIQERPGRKIDGSIGTILEILQDKNG
jgi:hypothetical protein